MFLPIIGASFLIILNHFWGCQTIIATGSRKIQPLWIVWIALDMLPIHSTSTSATDLRYLKLYYSTKNCILNLNFKPFYSDTIVILSYSYSRTERNHLFFPVKGFRYWLSRRVSDKSPNVSRQMWPWPGRIGTIPRPTGLSGGGQVVWSCWGVIQQTHPTASVRDWGSEWPWSVGWPRLGEVAK